MPVNRTVNSINREALQFCLEVGKSSYPNEFAALLRKIDNAIGEVVFLPGTLSNERSALIHLHMSPIDLSIVGSVHSHPTRNNRPSYQDIEMFQSLGNYHIIVNYPFSQDDWVCYGRSGSRIKLDVSD